MITIPDQQLSKYFSLSDLTTTTHTDVDNTPDQDQIDNLTTLAQTLDLLYDYLAPQSTPNPPFHVTSGFRSVALNAALQDSSSTSQHMEGEAADLLPSNMSIQDLFVQIYTSNLRNNFGQIIIEADQGIVHVGLPTFTSVGVAMLKENGSYRKMTQDEIAALVGVDVASNDEDFTQTLIEDPLRTAMAFLFLAGAVTYYLYTTRQGQT